MFSCDPTSVFPNDPPRLPVLTSIEAVVSQSRMVSFHPEQLQSAVTQWGHLLEASASWHHPCHFFDGSEETVRWIFVLDVLNHCFWPDVGSPVWTVSYQGESWSGYWGLAASLKRGMEQGFPITKARYLATIAEKDLLAIFAGEGEIPMFAERLANLREAGDILESCFDGDVLQLVGATQGSGVRAVLQVVAAFPSFRDEASYRGRTIHFWKRAQILVADLYHAFSGKGWGAFFDIDRLTAFADYKLPQVLRCLGVISYHADLGQRIDHQAPLRAGSEEEVEIRAATIWAVEAFRIAFQHRGITANSMHIDQWLWRLGQLEPFRGKPYHRCRTIFY
jgi:hypothetical protein